MTRFPRRRPPLLVAFPLAALAVSVLPSLAGGVPHPAAGEREVAEFAICSGPERIDCVVDGDTFWYQGRKVRLADVNAPEVSEPRCAREAELGAAATARLVKLLSAGPFTLVPADRDRDSYGRLLRIATRGGSSLGAVLEREGLAEPWRGYRGDWCRGGRHGIVP